MLRSLLHFFAIGAALLALQAATSSPGPERPVLRVRVPAGASEADVRHHVDAALLVEEGLRMGWVATDPIVRDRLARNMRFLGLAGEGAADETLIQAALGLGMQRTDPIVRQRLIQRAGAVLDRAAERLEPTDSELRAHLRAHPGRFASGDRIRFAQIFLSRERRGPSLDADAEALARSLGATPPSAATRALGDPLLIARPEQRASREELSRTYSPAFADAAMRAPTGAWSGPIASPWGLHLLWVHAAEPAPDTRLEDVRDRVLSDWRHDQRDRARRDRLADLRARYTVQVALEAAP